MLVLLGCRLVPLPPLSINFLARIGDTNYAISV